MDHNKVENTIKTNNKRKFSDINQNESDKMNENTIINRKRKTIEIDHYQSNNNYCIVKFIIYFPLRCEKNFFVILQSLAIAKGITIKKRVIIVFKFTYFNFKTFPI